MKLFQIEEPDGSPVDPDAPGVAIGISLAEPQAEVAVAVGGNAVVLHDREDFPLDLTVPPPTATPAEWRDLFEAARMRAERALAQPVTHAVVVLGAAAEPVFAEKVNGAAQLAGLTLLDLLSPKALAVEQRLVLAAALLAEDLAPRQAAP